MVTSFQIASWRLLPPCHQSWQIGRELFPFPFVCCCLNPPVPLCFHFLTSDPEVPIQALPYNLQEVLQFTYPSQIFKGRFLQAPRSINKYKTMCLCPFHRHAVWFYKAMEVRELGTANSPQVLGCSCLWLPCHIWEGSCSCLQCAMCVHGHTKVVMGPFLSWQPGLHRLIGTWGMLLVPHSTAPVTLNWVLSPPPTPSARSCTSVLH